ncbi:disulfide bond formation protein DsbB [Thalassotalea aquiviva]|uniref:disulfide bond formation protein DsbB n=1 Tax=Thalassotalea aquiviva TaxID=3242415 RepID=UPI00352A919E
MLSRLNQFVLSPTSWWLLAGSAIGLELCALFFQYVLELEPCIMCIYQRVAVLGLLGAGVVGALGNKSAVLRFIAFGLWGYSAISGLLLAREHVDMQSNANSLFYTCDLVPNFPSWLPLHEWLPAFFEATGDCGEISWSFLGYSMPQWLIVTFAVYTLLFAIFFSSRIVYLINNR